jgi:hypothetical protein
MFGTGTIGFAIVTVVISVVTYVSVWVLTRSWYRGYKFKLMSALNGPTSLGEILDEKGVNRTLTEKETYDDSVDVWAPRSNFLHGPDYGARRVILSPSEAMNPPSTYSDD